MRGIHISKTFFRSAKNFPKTLNQGHKHVKHLVIQQANFLSSKIDQKQMKDGSNIDEKRFNNKLIKGQKRRKMDQKQIIQTDKYVSSPPQGHFYYEKKTKMRCKIGRLK